TDYGLRTPGFGLRGIDEGRLPSAARLHIPSMLAASAILLPHAVGQCLAAQAAPPVYGYKVVKAYPHDPEAYTQGLIYRDTFLYESTGRNGHSTLRKVKLETGEVLQQQSLDPEH